MNNIATWCGAPSATNPCVVKIMPGIYQAGATINMQQYVDIEGSGENVTKIQVDGTVIVGASNSELRSLTVECIFSGGDSSVIYNNSAYNGGSPKITDVTVLSAGGGGNNFGINNTNHASPVMNNVTVAISGNSFTSGIGNFGYAAPQMRNLRVTVTGSGGGIAYGIYNQHANPEIADSRITVSGLNWFAAGVRSDNGSSVKMSNLIINSSGHGIYNDGNAFVLANSTIAASQCGINHNGGGSIGKIDNSAITSASSICTGYSAMLYVGHTKLEGTISSDGTSTTKCNGVYDGNYDSVTCP